VPDSVAEMRKDVTAGRFTIDEDGAEAELIYRRHGARLILIHTEVPDSLSGRGIGARLVRAVLSYARTEQLTVVPWCPFAKRWLNDHNGETEGVPIDWDTLPPPDDRADG
jgi:predicted GNAT family acetyltransferase